MVTNVAADSEAFTSNAFLVAGERTVLVDPGSEFDAVAAVDEALAAPETADELDAVVLTHTHPDHGPSVTGDARDHVEAALRAARR